MYEIIIDVEVNEKGKRYVFREWDFNVACERWFYAATCNENCYVAYVINTFTGEYLRVWEA